MEFRNAKIFSKSPRYIIRMNYCKMSIRLSAIESNLIIVTSTITRIKILIPEDNLIVFPSRILLINKVSKSV